MLCQECGKRPASLHFTKIINGEKTEYHICEACARERGEAIPGTSNGFSIHNLISGLLDFTPAATVGSKPAELRCGQCGLTYSQFGKLGRFGCSACYQYFSDRLNPLLKRVHGNVVHVGKVPRKINSEIQGKREIERLKKELQKSVEKEEFETAARIRDKIRELEKKNASM
ncbi:MAG TPA: UvrB/UvrC motif-containing protein [Bacilli bacterium]